MKPLGLLELIEPTRRRLDQLHIRTAGVVGERRGALRALGQCGGASGGGQTQVGGQLHPVVITLATGLIEPGGQIDQDAD